MSLNFQKQKRGLLVLDQAYVKEVCKSSNVRLEYSKLPPELENLIPGLRFYEKWFITSVQNPSEQEKLPFYQWLRSAPPNGPQYRLDLRELKRKTFNCSNCHQRSSDFVQKGVDIAVATLILKHSFQNLADVIVLFAGDGDFKEMLRICRDELHREIYIIGKNDNSVSPDLQGYGQVIWLDDILGKVTFPALPMSCVVCGTEPLPEDDKRSCSFCGHRFSPKQVNSVGSGNGGSGSGSGKNSGNNTGNNNNSNNNSNNNTNQHQHAHGNKNKQQQGNNKGNDFGFTRSDFPELNSNNAQKNSSKQGKNQNSSLGVVNNNNTNNNINNTNFNSSAIQSTTNVPSANTKTIIRWVWKGDNGFQDYDIQTANRLEQAWHTNSKQTNVQIDKERYVNFDTMLQVRYDNINRSRAVKRQEESIQVNTKNYSSSVFENLLQAQKSGNTIPQPQQQQQSPQSQIPPQQQILQQQIPPQQQGGYVPQNIFAPQAQQQQQQPPQFPLATPQQQNQAAMYIPSNQPAFGAQQQQMFPLATNPQQQQQFQPQIAQQPQLNQPNQAAFYATPSFPLANAAYNPVMAPSSVMANSVIPTFGMATGTPQTNSAGSVFAPNVSMPSFAQQQQLLQQQQQMMHQQAPQFPKDS